MLVPFVHRFLKEMFNLSITTAVLAISNGFKLVNKGYWQRNRKSLFVRCSVMALLRHERKLTEFNFLSIKIIDAVFFRVTVAP